MLVCAYMILSFYVIKSFFSVFFILFNSIFLSIAQLKVFVFFLCLSVISVHKLSSILKQLRASWPNTRSITRISLCVPTAPLMTSSMWWREIGKPLKCHSAPQSFPVGVAIKNSHVNPLTLVQVY